MRRVWRQLPAGRSSDQLMAELEKSAPERFSSHQNVSVAIQGQIDLIRTHQANQDRRISYALAREAEEADGRSNERCFLVFRLFFFFWFLDTHCFTPLFCFCEIRGFCLSSNVVFCFFFLASSARSSSRRSAPLVDPSSRSSLESGRSCPGSASPWSSASPRFEFEVLIWAPAPQSMRCVWRSPSQPWL